MLRLLHTADWQIGRQYARFDPEDAGALFDARFDAVERIAALACAEGVDAVLVAGDVFDAQTVSDRTLLRLFQALEGYAGAWILIPGNHDAALAESVWTRAARLRAIPDHAHVLLTPGVREFPALELAVLAAPLTQRQTHGDLTEWFDGADTAPGLLRVGLAHGSVQGILAEDIDSANPIAADRARRARLDYLALGDWHGLKQVDARTWYSGTPEQERFKDNGAGQVLRVDLPGPGLEPVVTARPMTRFRWESWARTLSVETDLDALLRELGGLTADRVLELRLAGQIDLADEARLAQALVHAQARCRSLRCERSGLRIEPTDADIAALHADGYVGEVIAELRARQRAGAERAGDENPQAELAREALVILAGLLRDQPLAKDPA
jgi:DNA repair exonuclease SbcCD nuclease subunit